jgi:hypothetical protein
MAKIEKEPVVRDVGRIKTGFELSAAELLMATRALEGPRGEDDAEFESLDNSEEGFYGREVPYAMRVLTKAAIKIAVRDLLEELDGEKKARFISYLELSVRDPEGYPLDAVLAEITRVVSSIEHALKNAVHSAGAGEGLFSGLPTALKKVPGL